MISFYFKLSIYQYRSKWLDRLVIDVYIPELMLAIEYQGLQHYQRNKYYQENVDKFTEYIERDSKKKQLCESYGVKIIYWPFTKSITLFELNKVLIENDFDRINPVDCISNLSLQLPELLK